MIVPKSIWRVSYEGKELAGSRPTMTCEVALMLGKGRPEPLEGFNGGKKVQTNVNQAGRLPPRIRARVL